MYTGYKGNTSINKSMSSVNTRTLGGESQLEGLQREVDNYTRKLEQQKRRLITVEEQHAAMLREYEEEKRKLDNIKKASNQSETSHLHTTIRNLEANLEKGVKLYDETMAQNAKLKAEIDTLRREKKNFREIYSSLEAQIAAAEEESNRRLEAIEEKKKRTEQLKSDILAVRQRNAEDKAATIKQFEVMERNYLEEKKLREAAKLSERNEKSQPIDTQPVLKMRLKKLIAKNKEKVKLIEQYQRNIKQIEEAFDQIRKGSGITDLEQITNTFIKSEEQNYSLYNYVDILSQNIDGLEEQNRQLERRIEQQRIDNDERKKQLAGTPDDQKRRNQVRNLVRQKQKVVEDLNELVQRIQPDLESTLLQLARSKYNDDPKKLYDYELGFNLSDRNIEQYLSDLEKYINILVEAQNEPVQASMRRTANTEAKEGVRAANAPNFTDQPQVRDDKEMMGENELKKFAEDFIDRKKGRLRE